jgi:hypothetical protein
MMTLFERVFLQEGHIGSCSSFFVFESSPSLDVDRDWPEEEKNENLTGIRFFSLISTLQLADSGTQMYYLREWMGGIAPSAGGLQLDILQ